MPTKKPTAPAGSAVGDEMIRDMTALVAAMEAGGMPAVRERFTVRKVTVAPAPVLAAADVKAAREAIGASQPVFAGFLGVSPHLVKGWERGTRTPTGPTGVLLADILADPARWKARLQARLAAV
jgi:DNA-binding transcriptional regulator YiaG